MNTIHITDRELAILKQALESWNDMTNDMLYEDVPTNLYPKADEPVILNKQTASVLRSELTEAFEKHMAIRMLLMKVGGRINEAGYSV